MSKLSSLGRSGLSVKKKKILKCIHNLGMKKIDQENEQRCL